VYGKQYDNELCPQTVAVATVDDDVVVLVVVLAAGALAGTDAWPLSGNVELFVPETIFASPV
jgi:hypothetical protein